MAKLEKIKPKPGFQRRNSTGNAAMIFSKPSPIPNYLRASIGSCHDLCKYGGRLESPAESERDRNRNVKKTTCRERKPSEPKNSLPLSSRKQPNQNPKPKPKPLVRKQTDGKSEMGRMPKVSKSKKETPSANVQTSEKSAEADERERVMHDDDDDQSSLSSPKKKERVDSAAKPWNKAIGVGRVVMKENGLSPLKQRMKMEKALGIGNGEGGSDFGGGHDGDGDGSVHEEDEPFPVELACRKPVVSSKPARISKDKVKALVDSFETLVNIQDSTSLRVYSRRRRDMWGGERCDSTTNIC